MTSINQLRAFLLPESAITVKVIFDNIRNYVICGLFVSLHLWFESGIPGAQKFIPGTKTQMILPYLSFATAIFALILVLLNIGQSVEICNRIFVLAGKPFDHFGRKAREAGWLKSKLMLVLLLIGFVLYCSAIAFLMYVVFAIFSSLLVFSASGARAL